MSLPAVAWLPEGIVLACLSVAFATDLARRIIPNRLVLLVLACGIALRLLSPPSPLRLGLLGPVAVLIALGLLASRDFVGWGDAKLITAVSVAVSPDRLLTLLMAIALAGGVLSCFYLVCRFVLRCGTAAVVFEAADADGYHADGGAHDSQSPVSHRFASLLQVLHRERARIVAGEPLPYAVAIAAGTLYTLATG